MANNRGVVYMGPGKVEVQSIDYPKLQSPAGKKLDHAVILKIVSTNICGSDQHMVRGRTTAPAGLVLGHEITIQPLYVSKLNTALQIVLVGASLLDSGFGLAIPTPLAADFLQCAVCLKSALMNMPHHLPCIMSLTRKHKRGGPWDGAKRKC